MSGIDVSAATEALEAGGGVENLLQQEMHGVVAGTPATPETPATQTADATPEATPRTTVERDPVTGRWVTKQPDASTEDTSFSNVDPNSLAPELQAIYKSLQADYTRKTQEIATQRKQYEGLGDPEQLQQAVQVYQQLQDPQYWPQLHAELSQGLQQLGYTPQQAAQIASAEVAQQQSGQSTEPDLSALEGDPDLAPVAQLVKSLQDEVSQMKQSFGAQQQAAQQTQLQQALIGEIQRQENAIRTSSPHYDDNDINNVYELASFYDGNLFDAQKRYEAIQQSTIERYISQKQGASQGAVALPGGAVQSYKQQGQPKDLDEAYKMALAAIEQVEAQDL